MNRRAFVAAVGGAALSPAAAVVVAAAPEVDLRPTDVAIGDDGQWLRLAVTGVEADRITLDVDVTPLAAEANVDLSVLEVDPGGTEVYAAELSDAAVAREDDRVRVRLAFDVADDADAFRARVALSDLDTADAEQASGLTYDFAGAADGEAMGGSGASEPFDVVDPARREPELSFRAGRLELGETEQELRFRAGMFPDGTEEGVVDVSVSSVATDAGVDLSDLAVGRVAASGAALKETTVLDRNDEVVRVAFEPDDPSDTVELAVTLVGLGTEPADTAQDVPYYAVVLGDARPTTTPSPDYHDAVARFDVVEGEATEAGKPTEEEQEVTPQSGTVDPDGSDGGDEAAENQPGFGAMTALATLAALFARWLGGDE
jgi:hypothetical protein